MDFSSLLGFLPKPVAIAIVSLVIGGAAVGFAETRYMTVADFTKSYVLELKGAIRDYRDDLEEAETDRERKLIRDQIEALLDELCEIRPEDPYCTNRTVTS